MAKQKVFVKRNGEYHSVPGLGHSSISVQIIPLIRDHQTDRWNLWLCLDGKKILHIPNGRTFQHLIGDECWSLSGAKFWGKWYLTRSVDKHMRDRWIEQGKQQQSI